MKITITGKAPNGIEKSMELSRLSGPKDSRTGVYSSRWARTYGIEVGKDGYMVRDMTHDRKGGYPVVLTGGWIRDVNTESTRYKTEEL